MVVSVVVFEVVIVDVFVLSLCCIGGCHSGFPCVVFLTLIVVLFLLIFVMVLVVIVVVIGVVIIIIIIVIIIIIIIIIINRQELSILYSLESRHLSGKGRL